MEYKYPFSSIGYRLEDEIFDILKEANKKCLLILKVYFKKNLKKIFQKKSPPNTLAVSNAASGLDLIANDLELSPKDEIICPVHTYCKCISFLKTGASIIWCDIDKFTWLSTKEDYLSKVSKTLKQLLLYTSTEPSNVYEIYDELRSKNIRIIEDCAQL